MSGERIRKILIVDDDPEIREILQLHLTNEGYLVLTVESVDKALKELRKGPVDLVLLDVRMGGKDGFDFLRAISSHHGKPKVPVIVMTGCTGFEGVMKELAVDGFVNKPFEMSFALKEVRRVLAMKPKTVYLLDAEGSEKALAVAHELREERFEVLFVRDWSAFEEYWKGQPADYIVMEYEQDSMPGEEMIRKIRKQTPRPLIVYSSSGMDFREKSLEAGASLYIGAPKAPAEVVTALRGLEIL